MDEKKNTADSDTAVKWVLMDHLQQLPKAIWPKIWWDIIHNRWPEELGNETDFVGWREYRSWLTEKISETVGVKACMRYYNTLSVNGHPAYFDDQAFDDFWDSQMYHLLQDISENCTDQSTGSCDKKLTIKLMAFLFGCLGGVVGRILAELLQLL